MSDKKNNKDVVVRKAQVKKELMSLDNTQELQILKDTYAKGATDTEFKMLFAVGNRVGADPFKKEIYLIPFWDSQARKMSKTPVVGIDWYRKQAGKSANYGGQGETEFGEDENTNRVMHPKWAITPIYNKRFTQPIRVKVFWSEIAKTDKAGQAIANWKSMPHIMMAKCSEAQGIKKAFPEEIGGVYTEEELLMPKGAVVAEYEEVKTNADDLKEDVVVEMTPEVLKQVKELIKRKGKEEKKMLDYFQREKLEDLTPEETKTAIDLLEEMPDAENTEKKPATPKETAKPEPQEAEFEDIPPPVEEMPAPAPKKPVSKAPAKKESVAAKQMKKGQTKTVNQSNENLQTTDEVVIEMVNELSAHDPKEITVDQKQFLTDVVAGELKTKKDYPTVFR